MSNIINSTIITDNFLKAFHMLKGKLNNLGLGVVLAEKLGLCCQPYNSRKSFKNIDGRKQALANMNKAQYSNLYE